MHYLSISWYQAMHVNVNVINYYIYGAKAQKTFYGNSERNLFYAIFWIEIRQLSPAGYRLTSTEFHNWMADKWKPGACMLEWIDFSIPSCTWFFLEGDEPTPIPHNKCWKIRGLKLLNNYHVWYKQLSKMNKDRCTNPSLAETGFFGPKKPWTLECYILAQFSWRKIFFLPWRATEKQTARVSPVQKSNWRERSEGYLSSISGKQIITEFMYSCIMPCTGWD